MARRARNNDGPQEDTTGVSAEPRKRRTRQNVNSKPGEPSNGKSVNLKNNNPMKKVLVANHHTADIIIPRSFPRREGEIHGKPIESLRFLSGMAIPVDAEIWASVKQRNVTVCRYLEQGLLRETESKRETGASMERTTSPSPPEHLLSDMEGKARVERETVSQAQL